MSSGLHLLANSVELFYCYISFWWGNYCSTFNVSCRLWLSSLIRIVSYIPLYIVFIINHIFLRKCYHMIQECRKHLIKDNVGKLMKTFQECRAGWFVHIHVWCQHCDRNSVNYWWDDAKLRLNLVTLTSVMQHTVPEVPLLQPQLPGGQVGGSFGVLELPLLKTPEAHSDLSLHSNRLYIHTIASLPELCGHHRLQTGA